MTYKNHRYNPNHILLKHSLWLWDTWQAWVMANFLLVRSLLRSILVFPKTCPSEGSIATKQMTNKPGKIGFLAPSWSSSLPFWTLPSQCIFPTDFKNQTQTLICICLSVPFHLEQSFDMNQTVHFCHFHFQCMGLSRLFLKPIDNPENYNFAVNKTMSNK